MLLVVAQNTEHSSPSHPLSLKPLFSSLDSFAALHCASASCALASSSFLCSSRFCTHAPLQSQYPGTHSLFALRHLQLSHLGFLLSPLVHVHVCTFARPSWFNKAYSDSCTQQFSDISCFPSPATPPFPSKSTAGAFFSNADYQ